MKSSIRLTPSEARIAQHAAIAAMKQLDNRDGEYYTCCLLSAELNKLTQDVMLKAKIVSFYQEIFGLNGSHITFGGLMEEYFNISRAESNSDTEGMYELRYTALAFFAAICGAKANKKNSGF